MDPLTAFKALGIALALGLLVGLQRERAASALAGIRTFPLITIFGAICALLSAPLGTWVFPAGLAAVTGVIAMGNYLRLAQRGLGAADVSPGITTEIAILVMFAVGGLAVIAPATIAITVGVGCAILLHAKGPLHLFAAKIGENDVRAILQFAVIAFVVLPVLPDRSFDPFASLNPRQIWMMVVLVVAMSLAGYIAYKALPGRHGCLAAGLLGGLVSSTATTASAARQGAGGGPTLPSLFIIVAATSVMFGRLLVEVLAAAPNHFTAIAPPLAIMLGVGLAVASLIWVRARRDHSAPPAPSNPAHVRSALFFGLVYALVLVAVAASRKYLGESGIHAVAAISGLTDMDAITLSASRMAAGGSLQTDTAWKAILVASISNLAFKSGIVAVMAGVGSALFRATLGAFGVFAGAAVALIVFWP